MHNSYLHCAKGHQKGWPVLTFDTLRSSDTNVGHERASNSPMNERKGTSSLSIAVLQVTRKVAQYYTVRDGIIDHTYNS